ncbi:FtsX-like permease family protein [Paracoccus aurantiacus]|uniref:FtsX-like permease family protein n=1 Tax=Paracoccus aurantiacus TaxID=2599412 RepID=A0A5C6S981_9RHOB|nr:FtsX-like permease family protein [Paracoccus aurantiacus]TXB70958.1 FtsX-like permease family protein [Paracoccus aurantiacus]
MPEIWAGLPVWAQEILLVLARVAPAVVLGFLVLRGFRIAPLLGGLLRRQAWISAVFCALIAVSVALTTGILSQERGIREGSARAADKFDLIVAAPGSEMTAMLAAVFLQPADMALLDGAIFDRIAARPEVDLAAPIAFGDSWQGAQVVGTTAPFVMHLSGDLAEGRMFETETEAIAGARVQLSLGAHFSPAHGEGHAAEDDAHGDFEYEIVGRMPLTGTPWDRALLVPVESVWSVHGLANGHDASSQDKLGPPFDPALFPGTPVILVRARSLAATYGLQAMFSQQDSMAFFPGAVLGRLHGLLGDIRKVMGVMSVLTQVLVTVGVLAGLMMLTRLIARRLALLRAIGAPRRFVFALVWSYAVVLVVAGTLLGLVIGIVAAKLISAAITAQTDILVQARPGWPEVRMAAAFVSLTSILALLPAFMTMRRNVARDLRG